MGESVGHDIALRFSLQAVVADGGRGLQRLIDVARIEEVVLSLRAVRPDAGEAIGLQFDAHLQRVAVRLAGRRLLLLAHPRQNAELVLHVVADLMRDHISLGEFAGVAVRAAAELVLQVVVECDVEIDALIVRAVERSHGRARETATALLGAAEQAQRWRMIGATAGSENFLPGVFGIAEHQRHELAGRIVRCAGGNRRRRAALLRACPPAGENLRAVEKHARIDTEIPADQADNDDRADAETTGAAGYTAARFAIVLHIVTGTKIIGTHCSFSFANPSPDAACLFHRKPTDVLTPLFQSRAWLPHAHAGDFNRTATRDHISARGSLLCRTRGRHAAAHYHHRTRH